MADCLFCGKDAGRWKRAGEAWQWECVECGGEGPLASSPAEAVAAWNEAVKRVKTMVQLIRQFLRLADDVLNGVPATNMALWQDFRAARGEANRVLDQLDSMAKKPGR